MFESSISKYFVLPKQKEHNNNNQSKFDKIHNIDESVNFSKIKLEKLDNSVEQEAMLIIKELNEKLMFYQEEIERKNEEIEVKNQEIEMKNEYKLHIDNLIRQVGILE